MSEQRAEAEIIAKVKRMLDMANDPRTNENEAKNAQEMAQRLMMRYNIESASLETPVNSDRKKYNPEYSALFEWQRELMRGIASVHFCHYSVQEISANGQYKYTAGYRKDYRHQLIGRTVNVTMCLNLYKYLCGAMDRLMPYSGQDRLKKQGISWRLGFIYEVVDRLRRRADEEKREHRRKVDEERARNAGKSDGTSLVMYYEDLYENEDCLNQDILYGREPGTTKRYRDEAREQLRRMTEQAKNQPVPERQKTPEELAKEEKADRKWRERYERQRQKEEAKIDRNAMRLGMEEGRHVSLNRQVNRRAEADPAPANAPKLGS